MATIDTSDWNVSSWKQWFHGGEWRNQSDLKDALKFRSVIRRVVQNRNPNLSGPRLEKFVDMALPRFKDSIINHFAGVATPELLTDRIVDFGSTHARALDEALNAFDQHERNQSLFGGEKDDTDVAYGGDRTITGTEVRALRLRSRYTLPGSETLQEPFQASLNDQAQSDVFTWQPQNETGEYNSIWLRNEQHNVESKRNAQAPRGTPNTERLVGTDVVPDSFKPVQDVTKIMIDKTTETIYKDLVKRGPDQSFALMDAQLSLEPFSGKLQESIMIPVVNLGLGYERDFTQGTSSQQINEFGMRNVFDSHRDMQDEPIDETFITKEDALMKIETAGFDYLESY